MTNRNANKILLALLAVLAIFDRKRIADVWQSMGSVGRVIAVTVLLIMLAGVLFFLFGADTFTFSNHILNSIQ